MISPSPALATTVTGSGPALLLAHDVGTHTENDFGTIVPALSAEHTVVAPDYPGSAGTPRAEGRLTLDGLADAIVAAADQDTFTVLGNSLGAAVAVRAAVRHPERVRGLVLTAGFATPDQRLKITIAMFLDCLARHDHMGYARLAALAVFGDTMLSALSPDQIEYALEKIAGSVEAGAEEQFTLMRTVDVTADLERIAVPTLVVAPVEDTFVAPTGSRSLADGIAGAEYAEIQAGHLVAEAGPVWLAHVDKFLARHGL
ncbi:alpha/beta fold hydrolase [Streptomyces ipomoeae]|jgi:pimeloyl-ACP methyl ester carboxylesterase|uniref:Hydrolase, alpha/beta domain protein n=2 Tax=Streptomyces ipomoeae TaxID=103232 RepID=L1KVY8_9ACTN|nr:alpha/beta hydrolase [Streptomyces ipomoeae]EKX64548.1 hydrolase, alpha/beta domain protein [Streptomyces ipomoeae 91-03]MDX2695312.1 alpha/beta hydrolase [Streptomyces ipomoeae]MDX2823205.1 alpha/beta hydrolase [Streptomyces ipomoeae]MDX2841326.1 alpha/beta hydrolase [Streptomyces ipomoeae]MDX2875796.1 alpha/beta hydrolase [Streptomyces ipomoeae]